MTGRHHADDVLYDTDVDGMLAHVGGHHRYAERIVDSTPVSYAAGYPQKVWKDARGTWDGVNSAAVLLGEVEAGTFWNVEAIVIEPDKTTDLGFAKVRLGSVNGPMRQLITVAAQGASVYFGGIPMYMNRGSLFVVCTQTTPAASGVTVSAQIRVIPIDG